MTFLDENCLLTFQNFPTQIKCYNPNNFEVINNYHFPISSHNLEFVGLIKLNLKENDGLAIMNTIDEIHIINYN